MPNIDWLFLGRIVVILYSLVFLWGIWVRHCRKCGFWWRRKNSGLEINREQETIFFTTTLTCSRCKEVEVTYQEELDPEEYPAHPDVYFG